MGSQNNNKHSEDFTYLAANTHYKGSLGNNSQWHTPTMGSQKRNGWWIHMTRATITHYKGPLGNNREWRRQSPTIRGRRSLSTDCHSLTTLSSFSTSKDMVSPPNQVMLPTERATMEPRGFVSIGTGYPAFHYPHPRGRGVSQGPRKGHAAR